MSVGYGKPLSDQDKLWWGKAEPKEDTGSTRFVVERYADFSHASAHTASSTVMIPPSPGLPGSIVEPLVHSADMGQTWYFADLGWVVPT